MTKISMAIAVTAIIAGGLFLFSEKTYAYRGDPSIQGPNHDMVVQAVMNNNYSEWKTIQQGKGVAQRVTESNWARFVEMVKLRLSGKISQADSIKTELGLGIRNGSGRGMNVGRWSK